MENRTVGFLCPELGIMVRRIFRGILARIRPTFSMKLICESDYRCRGRQCSLYDIAL